MQLLHRQHDTTLAEESIATTGRLPQAARDTIERLKGFGYEALPIGETALSLVRGEAPVRWALATDAPVDCPLRFGQTTVHHLGMGMRIPATSSELLHFGRRQLLGIDSVVSSLDGRLLADPLGGLAAMDATTPELFFTGSFSETAEFLSGDDKVGAVRAPRIAAMFGNQRPLRIRDGRLALLRMSAFTLLDDITEDGGDLGPLRDEIDAMLRSPHRAAIWRQMLSRPFDFVADALFPGLGRLRFIHTGKRFHAQESVLEHTLMVLAALDSPTIAAALAALLHDIGKQATQAEYGFRGHDERGARYAFHALRRLGYDRQTIDEVVYAVRVHMDLRSPPHSRGPRMERIRSLSDRQFEAALAVHTADIAGRQPGSEAPVDRSREYRRARNEELQAVG